MPNCRRVVKEKWYQCICLLQRRDCEGAEDSNTAREYLEQALLEIKLKCWLRQRRWEWALTNRFGVCYSLPDARFDSWLLPTGGRAGRGIDSAVGILLCGSEAVLFINSSVKAPFLRRRKFMNTQRT